MERIRFDFGNLMATAVDGGVEEVVFFKALTEEFRRAHADVTARHKRGDLGFLDLPYASETVARIAEAADGYAQHFEDVVVLGIGGSGLGAAVLRDALLGPLWNGESDDSRNHFPRLHVVDNVDSHTFQTLLNRFAPSRTLFNVVSKSGGTAETMTQYLAARAWVERSIDPKEIPRHFIFTTDPSGGVLRQIGEKEGVPMLPIPENVGGRFSVLSSVGLFPVALCGVEVDKLLAGAADMEKRCRTDHMVANPAGVLAALLYYADVEAQRSVHVLMPYADRLRSVALWFQQLWAESLGKAVLLTGEKSSTGPTPLAALGATDQHSLLQLLMEGPHDKVVLFIDVGDPGIDVEISECHEGANAPLSYLAGHTMGQLLRTERAATAEALRQEGRPNATFHMPKIGAGELGQLLMLFQIATVYAGAMYQVDPLDQPGVELSKQLTYGLMGRKGYEVPAMPEPDPRWTL